MFKLTKCQESLIYAWMLHTIEKFNLVLHYLILDHDFTQAEFWKVQGRMDCRCLLKSCLESYEVGLSNILFERFGGLGEGFPSEGYLLLQPLIWNMSLLLSSVRLDASLAFSARRRLVSSCRSVRRSILALRPSTYLWSSTTLWSSTNFWSRALEITKQPKAKACPIFFMASWSRCS